MAMQPKKTENTFYLYDTFQVSKNLKHVRRRREVGGKIDKVYWVLLAAAGSAVLFALGVLFKWR